MVILGVGLAGLFGGALFTVARRRAAAAGSSGTGGKSTKR
jgi:hypothetical protein